VLVNDAQAVDSAAARTVAAAVIVATLNAV
jgi:hypothetical protein